MVPRRELPVPGSFRVVLARQSIGSTSLCAVVAGLASSSAEPLSRLRGSVSPLPEGSPAVFMLANSKLSSQGPGEGPYGPALDRWVTESNLHCQVGNPTDPAL